MLQSSKPRCTCHITTLSPQLNSLPPPFSTLCQPLLPFFEGSIFIYEYLLKLRMMTQLDLFLITCSFPRTTLRSLPLTIETCSTFTLSNKPAEAQSVLG